MTTKICCDCKIAKPLEQFNKAKGRAFERSGRCKPCQSIYHRIWYENNKERVAHNTRSNRYKRDFNMSVEEYEVLFDSQNRSCAICGTSSNVSGKLFPVDHNHKTGAVRGILCDTCNTGLGMFKDNPSLLAKAITYLGN